MFPRRDNWHIVENLSRIATRKVSVWNDEEDDRSDDYEEEEEEEEEEVVSVIESSIISTEAILEESDSEIISRVEVHTNTQHIPTLLHRYHLFILIKINKRYIFY